MKHLNETQTAFLAGNLLFAISINDLPKRFDLHTAAKVTDLGTDLLKVIGVEENSEAYREALKVMERIHKGWAEIS